MRESKTVLLRQLRDVVSVDGQYVMTSAFNIEAVAWKNERHICLVSRESDSGRSGKK